MHHEIQKRCLAAGTWWLEEEFRVWKEEVIRHRCFNLDDLTSMIMCRSRLSTYLRGQLVLK